MKVLNLTSIVLLGTWAGVAWPLAAETVTLTDGTVLEAELVPPKDVLLKTAEGDRRVPFALLPFAVQRLYWTKPDQATAEVSLLPPTPSAPLTAPVSDEEIAALANEVALETWAQVAAIGSFRDKPEKRGVGGLVVTKAFNAIEENWVSVYSPKDAVGQAGTWAAPLAKAKALEGRPVQFLQKRWLENFIKAAEAVAARDSNEFALLVRELKKSKIAAETPKNFFTAK